MGDGGHRRFHPEVEAIVSKYSKAIMSQVVHPMTTEIDRLESKLRTDLTSKKPTPEEVKLFESKAEDLFRARQGIDSFLAHVRRGLEKRSVPVGEFFRKGAGS